MLFSLSQRYFIADFPAKTDSGGYSDQILIALVDLLGPFITNLVDSFSSAIYLHAASFP